MGDANNVDTNSFDMSHVTHLMSNATHTHNIATAHQSETGDANKVGNYSFDMSRVTHPMNHVTHTQQRTKVTGDPDKVDTYFSQIDAGYKTLVELSDRWDEYMAAGDGDVYIHPSLHPPLPSPPPHTHLLPLCPPLLLHSFSHIRTRTHIYTH